jgi:3-hydroxyisobutyrate dehydrogenase
MVKTVSVVGVGAMGAPIARRLLANGFEVTVYDNNAAVLQDFAEAPAVIASSLAKCAATDLIIILVATAEQVRQVLFAPDGIASAITAEHAPLVSITSTVGRETVVEVDEALKAQGARVIDAPISGGPLRAEQGTLSVIMGGEVTDIETARPAISSFGKNLFHCGPIGAGQIVKIANNILGNLNTMATAEVFRLLLEHDLDLEETCQVFEASSGRNWMTRSATEAVGSFATLAPNEAAFDSTTAIMRKDGGLAEALAAEVDGEYPVINTMATLIRSLGAATYENWNAVASAAAQPAA